MNFGKEVQAGKSRTDADRFRHFRGPSRDMKEYTLLADRFGKTAFSKAHLFVLQYYTTEAEMENRGADFFETFGEIDGERRAPTQEVVFFEAQDGCKGTPCPVYTQQDQFLQSDSG